MIPPKAGATAFRQTHQSAGKQTSMQKKMKRWGPGWWLAPHHTHTHTIFIFLHQSVANKTHRSRACKASEDVISMQMSPSLSRSLLAKAASPPGRGGQHIHSCVHWNLTDVSKRCSKKDLTWIYLIYKLEWLHSQVTLDMAGKNPTAWTPVV